jgi:single-stranded-DNA-specific exonuclease
MVEGQDGAPDSIIVLHIPGIHESIAGIVAGRIRDRYARPAIVLTNSKDNGAKGSGRSVESYDMFSGLNELKEILSNFGGHNSAVGLSLEGEDVDIFRERINAAFDMGKTDLTPKVQIDLEYPIEYVSFELINELKLLEPYGKGNARPLFAAKAVIIEYAALVGLKRNVVRLKISSEKRKNVDAVFFGDSEVFIEMLGITPDDSGLLLVDGFPQPVDITYHPEINTFRGFEKTQLILHNIRLSKQ